MSVVFYQESLVMSLDFISFVKKNGFYNENLKEIHKFLLGK